MSAPLYALARRNGVSHSNTFASDLREGLQLALACQCPATSAASSSFALTPSGSSSPSNSASVASHAGSPTMHPLHAPIARLAQRRGALQQLNPRALHMALGLPFAPSPMVPVSPSPYSPAGTAPGSYAASPSHLNVQRHRRRTSSGNIGSLLQSQVPPPPPQHRRQRSDLNVYGAVNQSPLTGPVRSLYITVESTDSAQRVQRSSSTGSTQPQQQNSSHVAAAMHQWYHASRLPSPRRTPPPVPSTYASGAVVGLLNASGISSPVPVSPPLPTSLYGYPPLHGQHPFDPLRRRRAAIIAHTDFRDRMPEEWAAEGARLESSGVAETDSSAAAAAAASGSSNERIRSRRPSFTGIRPTFISVDVESIAGYMRAAPVLMPGAACTPASEEAEGRLDAAHTPFWSPSSVGPLSAGSSITSADALVQSVSGCDSATPCSSSLVSPSVSGGLLSASCSAATRPRLRVVLDWVAGELHEAPADEGLQSA